MMIAATPSYSLGDKVVYRDRQKRLQQGEVKRIEASWYKWASEGPLIIYTLSHPTYRGNNFHTSGDNIVSLINT